MSQLSVYVSFCKISKQTNKPIKKFVEHEIVDYHIKVKEYL